MTTDRAFKLACHDLKFCLKVWGAKDIAKYKMAEAAYRRAVEIRDTYFPNQQKTNTNEQH